MFKNGCLPPTEFLDFLHKSYNVCRLFTFARLFWTLQAGRLSGFGGGRAFRGEAAVLLSDRDAGRADRRLLSVRPLLRLSGGSLAMGRPAVGAGRLLQGKVISVRMGVVVVPRRRVCLRKTEIARHRKGAGHWTRWRRVGNVIHCCSFRTFVRLVQAIRALLFYIRWEWTLSHVLTSGLINPTGSGRFQPRLHPLDVGSWRGDNALGARLVALTDPRETWASGESIRKFRPRWQIHAVTLVVWTAVGSHVDQGVHKKRISSLVVGACHLCGIICRRMKIALSGWHFLCKTLLNNYWYSRFWL